MNIFHRFASGVSRVTGSPKAFLAALTVVTAWAVSGPFFHFSDTWQLVINTGTTIMTFLMVFVIQASQNHDNQVIQLKLDELVRSSKNARNRFADLEGANEDELKQLVGEFKKLREKDLVT